MQMAALIGEALEEAGTAVAVLEHPERGRASLITHVNATLATLFGQSRSDDHSFVLWFDHADEERNAAVLATIVRDVRLRFLTDFGTEIASHVSAAIVSGDGTDPNPAPRPQRAPARAAAPPGTAFEQMLRARQHPR
jgi:hypothetical protein